MELGGGRGRKGWSVVNLLCISFSCCCFLFCACALLVDAGRTTAHLATGVSCGRAEDSPTPRLPPAAEGEEPWRGRRTMEMATAMRRNLVGPGSYPPRCASKCGDCTPCKPVHVPVPPGTPVITEYYPEAWRCKCGGRLYMP